MQPRLCLVFFALAALLQGCPDLGGPVATAQPASYDVGGKDSAGVGSDTAATDDTKTGADTAGNDSTVGGVDSGGSCVGACNNAFIKGRPCQCNDGCAKFGNCCVDYGPVCVGGPQTCEGRCDADYQPNKPCQCSWDCAKFGTCCPDWVSLCHAKDPIDFFTVPAGKCTKDSDWKKVAHISDGDTFLLEEKNAKGDNIVVRFLLVDTPEMTTEDCYALEAKKFTYAQIQKSPSVCLVAEPKSDDKDIYGRLLRYVFYREPALDNAVVELNMRLLRLGYARVLYPFAKGNPNEAVALLTMAKAKEGDVGGWGKCGWLKPK
jgi:endonuclease YncB( thermonuclease family)